MVTVIFSLHFVLIRFVYANLQCFARATESTGFDIVTTLTTIQNAFVNDFISAHFTQFEVIEVNALQSQTMLSLFLFPFFVDLFVNSNNSRRKYKWNTIIQRVNDLEMIHTKACTVLYLSRLLYWICWTNIFDGFLETVTLR